jgi:acetylornithine deacetylase
MTKETTTLQNEAFALLQELIALSSFSGEEWQTASLLTKHLFDKGMQVTRVGNNVFVRNSHFDPGKPTLLLNSHHDTVRPNPGYTRDPFQPSLEGDRLFGLGSNDAGGALVALLAAFDYFHDRQNLRYNLVFAATAEEEISGKNGIESVLPHLPPIDAAIVGEPTEMQLAIAERGLLVLDGTARGKSGHAARREGVNALYLAMEAIRRLQAYSFPRVSPLLGPTSLMVTSIETPNKAHNVVPDRCHFTVDVRVNEQYTLEEVARLLGELVYPCQLAPRSLRLRPSLIPQSHPLVAAGLRIGRSTYGSPTTSDKALLPFPALKMGPGKSERSHTADEFILVSEINEGILLYLQLLNNLL